MEPRELCPTCLQRCSMCVVLTHRRARDTSGRARLVQVRTLVSATCQTVVSSEDLEPACPPTPDAPPRG